MYVITKEIREGYTWWVTILYGHKTSEEIAIGNGSIIVHIKFRAEKEILDQQIKNRELHELLSPYTEEKEYITGYDGRRIYHELCEINNEDVNKVIDIIQENDGEKYISERPNKISESKNIHEYMTNLNACLSLIERGDTDSVFRENVLKHIDIYKEKQFQKAKETGEPQLIYFEMGMPHEKKGAFVREEFINPDGTTKKHEYWEYEQKGR